MLFSFIFSSVASRSDTGFWIVTSLDMLKSYLIFLVLILYGYVFTVPSWRGFIEKELLSFLFYERWYTGTSHSAAFPVLSWQPAAAFYSQHASGVITSRFLSSANIRDPPETCHLYRCKSIFIYFLQGLWLCPIQHQGESRCWSS